MTVKVGIPRALMYYEFFPMWNTFFEELGAEIIISPKTNKKIVNEGIRYCVDEICLPIKVFHGHISYLKDKCDYIFAPRLKSIRKNTYICPKFCGLPNMVKFSINNLPIIIDEEINLRDSNNLFHVYKKIGRNITDNNQKIKYAYSKACEKQNRYINTLRKGILPIDILNKRTNKALNKQKNLNVLILGQVYTLYDEYISMNLIDKLYSRNVSVITPEYIEEDLAEKIADESLHKKMFWSHSEKIVGSMFDVINNQSLDGIIFIMSFGCGIDALVSEVCERLLRRTKKIPFILLTIDEHTGDAGFNTRLEAFLDMLNWRNENEGYISAHG